MPRIAVITPYYREPIDILRQCHLSVTSQKVEADHFLVADGFPNEEIGSWKARHAILPVAHADNGNTPRSVGSLLADAEGYDFIAYLDADNWFHPNHLSSLLELHERTTASVCCSWRTFHRPDGTQMPIDQEPGERQFRNVDTSCFLLHRSAFPVLSVWHRMPREISPICDKVLFLALRHARFRFAFSKLATLAFRTQYAFHYQLAGEDPPPGTKPLDVVNQAISYLQSRHGIADVVERLGFWPIEPHLFG